MEPSKVCDRDTFIEFLQQFRSELSDPLLSENWENTDLMSFLEAMQAWTEDWHESFPDNPWEHAATMLHVASTYE